MVVTNVPSTPYKYVQAPLATLDKCSKKHKLVQQYKSTDCYSPSNKAANDKTNSYQCSMLITCARVQTIFSTKSAKAIEVCKHHVTESDITTAILDHPAQCALLNRTFLIVHLQSNGRLFDIHDYMYLVIMTDSLESHSL